jgi:hypothetical protein
MALSGEVLIMKWIIKETKRDDGSPYWVDAEFRDDERPYLRAAVKWDGCIHLEELEYDSKDSSKFAQDQYWHICDLDGFIKQLEELRELAQGVYGKDWP